MANGDVQTGLEQQYQQEIARGAITADRPFADWVSGHTANVQNAISDVLGRPSQPGEAELIASRQGNIDQVRQQLGNPSFVFDISAGLGEQRQREFVDRQRQEREQLQARQRSEEEGLFREFEGIAGGQEKLTDALGRLRGEAGIPELEQTLDIFKGEARSIKDLLDRLDEDITSRTQGTLTTEAQRRRQIAAEEEPLQRTLGRLGTAAEPILEKIVSGEANVAQQLQLLTVEQQKELQPILLRIDKASERFAREFTGYTADKQAELSLLLNQLQSRQQLALAEWQRAQDLAAEERQFSRQKELLEKEFAQQERLAMSGFETIDLGDRVQIVSPQGEVIREIAKGKLPGSGSGSDGFSFPPELINEFLGIGREDLPPDVESTSSSQADPNTMSSESGGTPAGPVRPAQQPDLGSLSPFFLPGGDDVSNIGRLGRNILDFANRFQLGSSGGNRRGIFGSVESPTFVIQ